MMNRVEERREELKKELGITDEVIDWSPPNKLMSIVWFLILLAIQGGFLYLVELSIGGPASLM